ncbi:MAG TPA: type II CAAX endopeptidase family protein [Pirellulaceae bacterium]|nr:type II CAAX endopeptidase family protein [Pirellulaceae bacterium]
MPTQQIVAAGILVSAFAFALAVTALIAARRMATLGELVPYQPGPRAKSGLLEFGVAFAALLIGQVVGLGAASYFADSDSPGATPAIAAELPGEPVPESAPTRVLDAPTLFGASTGALVAVLTIYVLWRFVLDRGPRALGVENRAATFGSDVGLGFWAFLISATPVYGLQALLMRFFPQRHPLIDRLDSGIDPGIFAAAAFAAVIAAPLTEEIVFRGFLLSAFTHVRRGLPGPWLRTLFGDTGSPDSDQQEDAEAQAVHETPVEFRKRGGTLSEGFRRTLAHIGSFPVVASSAIFALLHLGQGPAPIPLFLFSLLLGYLYRQTGRITPSVVAHFALNGTTILLTGLSALDASSERNRPADPPPAVLAIDSSVP